MNVIGMRMLFTKETHRFLRAPIQTLVQPVLNTGLYFLVFGYALGGRLQSIGGVPYIRFIVPGLIMQSIISNAIFNTSSSMFSSKMQGTITDLLLAPFTTFEILFAYVAAALARCMAIAFVVWAVAAAFTSADIAYLTWVLVYSVLVGATFSLAGIILAIVADDFEQLNLVPSFVVAPLTFLGGVFYSPGMLPEPWGTITKLNPIFYMVDGLRHGLLGHSDADIWVGFAMVFGSTVVLLAVAWVLIERGYKLRS